MILKSDTRPSSWTAVLVIPLKRAALGISYLGRIEICRDQLPVVPFLLAKAP
jgi:hypothetical protein